MASPLYKLSPTIRYTLGALFAAVSLAFQWLMVPWTGDRVPFIFFIPAAALTAAFVGRGPAFIVFAAGAYHGARMLGYFNDVAAMFGINHAPLAAYCLVGALSIMLGGAVRTSEQRAARAEKEALLRQLEAQAFKRESDDRFRVALESSTVPFNIVKPVRDAAGRIVDFQWTLLNGAAARVMQREPDALLGRRLSEVFPAVWDDKALFERYVGVCERGESHQFESQSHVLQDGRWFDVIASPLQDSVAVWYADITERKQREQSLIEDDRRKNEFLATLAHELRNPLAPIRQAAFISRSPGVTEAQQVWCGEVIERQVRNMSLLLDDLLDVSRITRGTITLRRERIAVRAFVESAVEMTQPLIDERGHRLAIDLPADDAYVYGDALRLAQVSANLLTNAAKYTPPGGAIVLRAVVVDHELQLSVTDNGVGISAESLPHIFQMFNQIKSNDEKARGGLGIGLALVKGLVELHGGSIRAESAGVRRGSCFTIRLPVGRDTAPRGAEHDDSGAAPSASRKVLIADDNRDAADSLALILEMDGHQVEVAYDGEAALDRFAAFQPDIALLDIGMPRLNGLEVAKRIRQLPSNRHAKLVAITGWGQSSDREKTAEAGFDLHLTKPIGIDDLSDILA